MNDLIPNFLKEKFQLRHANAKKFPHDIKQFMFDYYNFYNWTFSKTLENIFVVMRSGISEIEECKLDTCNEKRAIQVRGKNTKILNCCCVSHSQKVTVFEKYGVYNISQINLVKEKKKNLALEKYGESSFLKTDEFKEKSKATNLLKYGCEHAMKNDIIKQKQQNVIFKNYGVKSPLMSGIIKEKTKKTNLIKYGCEWILSNKEIREKSKETYIENYGFDHPMKNKEYREKVKASNIENYGVSNPMKVERIKNKQQLSLFKTYGVFSPMHSEELKNKCLSNGKETILKKYGVHNIMHIPEYVEKAQAYSKSNKTYTWNTGELVSVQGYEYFVLKELEDSGYSFDEVKTNKSDMPTIWYEFAGRKHRYYPDIYIPIQNLIIEVKSEYYMLKEFQKNLIKALATKNLGFQFKFEVR